MIFADNVSFLYDRIPGGRSAVIPFTLGAYTDEQNGYGVILEANATNSIHLFEISWNTFTQIGYLPDNQIPKEGQVDLRFEINDSIIRVYLNNSLIFSGTDSTHQGPYKIIDKSFARQPTILTIRRLKKLGKLLTTGRDPAYYSEKRYSKTDAVLAIEHMKESFEITKAFFLYEEDA